MIISHRHRYVFVELPRTGSTAVSDELRAHYDGVRILAKHSTYHDFLRIATEDEKRYFTFSCIRDPLDDAVSRYLKLVTDHHQRFSHPVKAKYSVGIKRAELIAQGDPSSLPKPRRRSVVDLMENRRYRFVRRTHADFPAFFRRYYHLPYDNWARLDHGNFDFLVRFENLQEDFATVLGILGVEQDRPLPVINRTTGKADFASYYTPDTIERAKRVFGPYMERWGYAPPAEWGKPSFPRVHRAVYDALGVPRTIYWRHLRGRI